MSWVTKMYLVCCLGSTLAVFWPTLIKLFKSTQPTALGAMSAPKRIGVFIGLGVVIGVVVAALMFAAFLGSSDNQAKLRATGSLAYFTAFSAGFAAGALFEEPLKQ